MHILEDSEHSYVIDYNKGKKAQYITDIIHVECKPLCCPETSVTNYQFTLHNVPEEPRPKLNKRK
jgi:hypothetical protein